MPQEYSDELLRLLDDVKPFPWREARLILEEDLGDLGECFEYINPRPVAAGSLAQVYTARTRDGARVAVKVLRPNIRQRVMTDLGRVRVIARVLRLAQVHLVASPEELVEEITEWLTREVNTVNELNNLTRLRELTRDSKVERIPRPYPELCGARVLTAEFLRGIPVSGLIRSLARDGREAFRREHSDLDLHGFAVNLVQATLRQIFRYQFFHADVHPGNLLLLPDNAIGYVDFGLCAEIDDNVRGQQTRYLSTVYRGDIPQMTKALLEILIPTEGANEEGFRADFMAESSMWLSRMGSEDEADDSAEGRSPTAQWLISVMRTARRHEYRVPARLLAMYRALLTVETIAHRLSPGTNIRTVGREFFVSLQFDEAMRLLEPESVQNTLLRSFTLSQNAPWQLNQLLTELNDERFTLRVQMSDDARAVRAKNQRTALLVTAIASVGVSLLLSLPGLPRLGYVSLHWPLAALLVGLYVLFFIQWRRMR